MGTVRANVTVVKVYKSFHSINVPSEWGLDGYIEIDSNEIKGAVSIQLMSPASGDRVWYETSK